MLKSVLSIATEYDDFLIALVLTTPRIYAFLSSSQLLSSASVPGLSRNGTILALVIFMFPVNIDFARHFDVQNFGAFAGFVLKEYALGVVLGYLVGWIFWVVQTAGTFIDNQRGASIASSIDPLLGAESSPMGDLFSLVFTTYLFATGSVLPALGLVLGSFKIWPLSQMWPTLPPDFARLILSIFDYAMHLGFTIASPVIAVMFLAEFALAMVSRFAPQIQVFILAMPIKSLLAIFVLLFYAEVLFPYADRQVNAAIHFTDAFYEIMNLGHSATRVHSTPGGVLP